MNGRVPLGEDVYGVFAESVTFTVIVYVPAGSAETPVHVTDEPTPLHVPGKPLHVYVV
jgi:hypothetical protein